MVGTSQAASTARQYGRANDLESLPLNAFFSPQIPPLLAAAVEEPLEAAAESELQLFRAVGSSPRPYSYSPINEVHPSLNEGGSLDLRYKSAPMVESSILVFVSYMIGS